MRQNGRKKESGGVWAVRIVSGILMILLALCAVFGLALAAGNLIGRKTAGGFRCFTVLTGSMDPKLTEGDLVIVGKTDAGQIAEGDIIVFYPLQESDDYLIHQVTEKVDNYEESGTTCFYTSGTKVKEEDGILVDEERVVGTVDVIFPKLGYIARFLLVRWYCVIIYISLLFLMLRMLEFWLKCRKPETGASEREYKKHEECLPAEDKK
ncbi:MAG: signal peptidase I, partial [Lachnospiraceae bacterium]|nr:signal peptidase I [Lachnospiraceae bacterium]